ncbi:hypothetical protein JJJ17_00125 [Paracoccus caeni]|uniref:Type III secretion protein n=1 Tax=Paracoccus caeni TaxID=657651 RepID=A0A934VY24_9RHOB|nr:hypothetical protein [Paracoccus caeni]MBK4214320.1 hypothetical protein [Paracoccus caeni]
MKKLLKLSSVRERLAQQRVAAARNLFRERAAEVARLRAKADALVQEHRDKRIAMRKPMLSNPQLRGAIDAIVATFDADRHREEAAEREVVAAQKKVAEAKTALDRETAALALVHRQMLKRQELCDVLDDDHQRDLARAEEAEQDERQMILARGKVAS